MDKVLSSHFVIEKIENETYYFKKENTYSINQIDINNSVISGEINFKSILEKHNFIETAIKQLTFDKTNLEACDFIDCSIEKTKFNNCNMTGAHINSSIVKDSKFILCANSLTNFNKSNFYNVEFENCDFSRLLIKDCKFFNCKFVNCKTTNKIFESCIIFNSEFKDMEIQTQTIFDNMGIINSQFTNITCRTARTTEVYELIDIKKIDTYSTNNLHKLNSVFFLHGTNEEWYSELYTFLESDLFYSRKKTPESLMGFLERLSEFLILLYENNIIFLHPIMKFHYLTYFWTETLEENFNTNNNVYRVLIGLHMVHTRYVQSFLTQLYLYFDSNFESISLIVDDEYIHNKIYYIKKLNGLINLQEENILAIKPYNSAELITGFQELYQYAPLVALVLSTRLKVNIENLNNKTYLANSEQQVIVSNNQKKLFNLEVGRGKSKDILFALKMQAIKPDSLLFDLSLDLNGKKVFYIYNYIIDFFKNISRKSL